MPSFQLSPGLVVDSDRREAYVMSPRGGIVAVDLAEGAPVWRTRKAAKPLTLAGELLIGQAEAPGPDNELRIVTLDTSRRGKQVTEALVELPPGIEPMIASSLDRSFTLRCGPSAGRLRWPGSSSSSRCAASPLGRSRCSPAKPLPPCRPRRPRPLGSAGSPPPRRATQSRAARRPSSAARPGSISPPGR